MSPVPNLLTIAGSDPSGGAGILADLRTFAALGVYGCAVPAALTAQNSVGVFAVHDVPGSFLRRQLDALFDDVRVAGVKVGMLGSAENVATVAAVLRERRPPCVVVDPVLRATTGASLLDADALDLLRTELLPLATVVTPNAPEAGILLDERAPATPAEARSAAARLVARGVRAVIVTGGHVAGARESVDVLHDGHSAREFRVPRIAGRSAHGTGCTYSSALAALLAMGRTLDEAALAAQRRVADGIRDASALGVGAGAPPVHQLGALWSVRRRGGC